MMKIVALSIGLPLACLTIWLVSLLFFSSLVAESGDSTRMYMTDKGPISQREAVRLEPGEIVRITQCIDTKSDAYFRVETGKNEKGYIYDIKIRKEWNFFRSPFLGPGNSIDCLLFP